MKIVAYLPLFGIPMQPQAVKAYVDMIGEKIEGYEIIPWIHTVGPSLDYNRNDAIERILGAHDPDFIICCDADNIQPKKVISKLLASMDDDIGAVSALYFKKTFPYSAVPGHYLPWDANLEKKRDALESQCLIGPVGE